MFPPALRFFDCQNLLKLKWFSFKYAAFGSSPQAMPNSNSEIHGHPLTNVENESK